MPNESFSIDYGDGSYASGPVFKDTVTFGSIQIPSQPIEVATDAGGKYEAPMSGIIGLGFDNGNQGLLCTSTS